MRAMPRHRVDLERFRNADDPAIEAELRLEASQIAVRRGDIREARRLLRATVRANPDYADALLGLAWLTENLHERKSLLRRVLALQPDHPQALAEMARLRENAIQPTVDAGSPKGPARLWILGPLVLVASLALVAILIWGPVDNSLAWLIPTATPKPSPTATLTPREIAAQFEPQLGAALAGEDWARAVEIVDIMRSVDPTGSDVQAQAQATYMQAGQALVEEGQIEDALPLFEQVLGLAPGDREAGIWQKATETYLAGEAALEQGQWDAAIQAFGDTHAQIAGYADVAERLVEAYRRKGEAAMDAQDWGTAVEALLQAREQAPGDVQVARLLSSAYRGQGEAAIASEDWDTAVESLAQAYARLPEDDGLQGLMATAYRQRGIARYDDGQLKGARSDLEAALAITPGDAEAKSALDQVMKELFPPKRIEIDISAQRFYAWEGDNLVHEYATSTGLPGRDTATGHYKVLDKIPMAYSSIWRLKMPHWLGIYYVGTVENGIHALPIRPDGSVMWGGLLGQKASYGCVILSTKAAEIIYNWADIGTPVDIHN
jgi:tetratricopeptide (TPR) repeat protein